MRDIANHFRCAKSGVHKALKRLGITRKKSKRYNSERDEKKREKFINFVNIMPKNRLVFVDESGFDEFLYREYARSPREEKVMAEVSGKRFERQNIVAGKRDKEILPPFGYSGTCDTRLFNFWLKNQLVPKLRKKQVVILDNAPIHKSEKTKMIIKKA